MNVVGSVCRTDKFWANFKQNLFQNWIKYLRPLMKVVFHAKIFGWFWLSLNTQYKMSKIQILRVSEAHRHFILQPFLTKFCKYSYFMQTKVPVSKWAKFVIPSVSLFCTLWWSLEIRKRIHIKQKSTWNPTY